MNLSPSLMRRFAAPALFVAMLGLAIVLASCGDSGSNTSANSVAKNAPTSAANGTTPKSSDKGGTGESKAIMTDKLEPFECGTISRMHTHGGVFLASQPQEQDIRDASANGIKTIVNLRKPGEFTDFDEPALVTELGMEYHSYPFKAPAELSDEVYDGVRKLLNDPTKRPMMIHCDSGNRVGAVWLAHRVLDGGLSWADAVAEAKMVGMKLPAYEETAKAYIAKRQAK